jgi:hypothetical protein
MDGHCHDDYHRDSRAATADDRAFIKSSIFHCRCCPHATASAARLRYTVKTIRRTSCSEAAMFENLNADGRFLGFNSGDWFMLFGGLIISGMVAMLL